jgi:hypothetical protein
MRPGIPIVARTPTILTTVDNSMRVNPFGDLLHLNHLAMLFIALPRAYFENLATCLRDPFDLLATIGARTAPTNNLSQASPNRRNSFSCLLAWTTASGHYGASLLPRLQNCQGEGTGKLGEGDGDQGEELRENVGAEIATANLLGGVPVEDTAGPRGDQWGEREQADPGPA